MAKHHALSASAGLTPRSALTELFTTKTDVICSRPKVNEINWLHDFFASRDRNRTAAQAGMMGLGNTSGSGMSDYLGDREHGPKPNRGECATGQLKAVVLFLGVLCILVAIYFSLRAIAEMRQGYSWQEMDWNQDGMVSITEFFSSSDIGQREVIQGDRKCFEYFSYKDGLPVKTVCPR